MTASPVIAIDALAHLSSPIRGMARRALRIPACRAAMMGRCDMHPRSPGKRSRHMQAFICTACGTQYPPSEARRPTAPSARTSGSSCRWAGRPGPRCRPCACRHFNAWRQHEPGLIGIGTQPSLRHRPARASHPARRTAISCGTASRCIDAATVTLIKGLGGLKAIAISHPHFYTTLVRVEPRLRRRARPPPRRRPALDHAARPVHRALAGRDATSCCPT